MTGVSGGGWQTITLSSLDERVGVAVPVAGFSALASRIEARRFGDLGDVEQTATDLFDGQDYTHLVAMVAPRPCLLIYNAEDDCCFRAALVKPLIFDGIRPLYGLYGARDAFQWHENLVPGTHNYEQDNRLAAYRFFSAQFHLPLIDEEIDVAAEVKTYDDLIVGLPKDNLTILGLAQKLGKEIERPPIPAGTAARKKWVMAERAKLKQVIRYQPVHLGRPWVVACTKSRGLESNSFLLEMDNGLCANAVWMRAADCPDGAPLTIVLNDKGKKEAAADVLTRISQGAQVLAADLIFIGDAWAGIRSAEHQQFVHGLGGRSLGLVSAQLIEIARWAGSRTGAARVRVGCQGLRSQVAALVVTALEPQLFSEVVVHEGIRSLSDLLEKPIEFSEAPEIFCLDLFKHFDLDRLQALSEHVQWRK